MENLTFKTKDDAIEFLQSIEGLERSSDDTYFYPDGTYHLAHGEYSKPDYKPRKYKDGWGVHVERYFYSGTIYAVQSGRVDPESFRNQFLLIK